MKLQRMANARINVFPVFSFLAFSIPCNSTQPSDYRVINRWNQLDQREVYLLIYLFPEFRMQQYKQQNSRVQYIHTWILKDQGVATYIAPIKQKMHLINTIINTKLMLPVSMLLVDG